MVGNLSFKAIFEVESLGNKLYKIKLIDGLDLEEFVGLSFDFEILKKVAQVMPAEDGKEELSSELVTQNLRLNIKWSEALTTPTTSVYTVNSADQLQQDSFLTRVYGPALGVGYGEDISNLARLDSYFTFEQAGENTNIYFTPQFFADIDVRLLIGMTINLKIIKTFEEDGVTPKDVQNLSINFTELLAPIVNTELFDTFVNGEYLVGDQDEINLDDIFQSQSGSDLDYDVEIAEGVDYNIDN